MLERERKFVLRRLPNDIVPTRVYAINQFFKDDIRYRMEVDDNITGGKPKYVKLKKVKISPGVNDEQGFEVIDYKEFYNEKNSIPKSELKEIYKTRYCYEYNGKIFEIDQFGRMNLVMMEVENVDLTDEIKFPPEIEKEILIEVTGNSNFDNFKLAQ